MDSLYRRDSFFEEKEELQRSLERVRSAHFVEVQRSLRWKKRALRAKRQARALGFVLRIKLNRLFFFVVACFSLLLFRRSDGERRTNDFTGGNAAHDASDRSPEPLQPRAINAPQQLGPLLLLPENVKERLLHVVRVIQISLPNPRDLQDLPYY